MLNPRPPAALRIDGAVFRAVPGFSSYAVARDGRIVNVRTGRALAPYANDRQGYLRVCLYRKNAAGQTVRRLFYAHRLVATLWVSGRTDERWQVHHIDRNLDNYGADNLVWVSVAEHLALHRDAEDGAYAALSRWDFRVHAERAAALASSPPQADAPAFVAEALEAECAALYAPASSAPF